MHNSLYKLNNTVFVDQVDDLILFAKEKNTLQSVTNILKNSLEITEIDSMTYLLGINFEQLLMVHYIFSKRLTLKN